MSLITKDYSKFANLIDWREWSSQYWSAIFVTGGVYRKLIAPRCRQCRNLPGHMRWTGSRVCVCSNPYINLSGAHQLPLMSRIAAGIKPWDKPLTSRQKAEVAAANPNSGVVQPYPKGRW